MWYDVGRSRSRIGAGEKQSSHVTTHGEWRRQRRENIVLVAVRPADRQTGIALVKTSEANKMDAHDKERSMRGVRRGR